MLSLILVIATIFPSVNVGQLMIVLAGVLAVGLIGITLFSRSRVAAAMDGDLEEDRDTWRMPPIALLLRPIPSRARLLALWSMRVYLFIAVALLLVKAVELATSH
jgi:hypothetical protein